VDGSRERGLNMWSGSLSEVSASTSEESV
jgi:hypothetical protein